MLENKTVTNIPKINPIKELYWKQFGGGPNTRLLERMKSKNKSAEEEPDKSAEKKPRKNKKQP